MLQDIFYHKNNIRESEKYWRFLFQKKIED